MEIIFAPKALKDIKYWHASGNNALRKKISNLLLAISEDPYSGIGKPEQLKYEYSGCWSRRINKEHRIIYEVTDGSVNILSLKDHY